MARAHSIRGFLSSAISSLKGWPSTYTTDNTNRGEPFDGFGRLPVETLSEIFVQVLSTEATLGPRLDQVQWRRIGLAFAIMGVCKDFNVAFMGLAGTAHQYAAQDAGVPFIAGDAQRPHRRQ